MLQLLRVLLFPLTLLYWVIVCLRNFLYNSQVLKSKRFDVPVISIGNLAVGGAGKSPMAEYILALFKGEKKLAVLSRGYGRSTKGFREVSMQSAADKVGDEPLQFKHKFADVTVAVCEDRVAGIERLKSNHEVIVLDDAFQHRAVRPGLSILLFDYTSLFNMQMLLPTGNLREPLSARKRADILVVTKTPKLLKDSERTRIENRVKPLRGQKLFFSYLEYGDLIPLNNGTGKNPLQTITPDHELIVLTGIANPVPLIHTLKQYTAHVLHHQYPDHHPYSIKNIAKLAASYNKLNTLHKLIVTTEKDAQRLQLPQLQELLISMPVYYLPVSARIHGDGEEELNQILKAYVT